MSARGGGVRRRGLFGRRRSRFPPDMLDRLELLGRFELDPMNYSGDAGEVGTRCVVPFYRDSQDDPDGFLADLRAIVAHDTGGFATYGASCLVWDMFSDFRTLDALALLDAAIAFKRAFGMPADRLRGYEMERWNDQHGPGSW